MPLRLPQQLPVLIGKTSRSKYLSDTTHLDQFGFSSFNCRAFATTATCSWRSKHHAFSVIGSNGVGKSNLLESVELLGSLRSHRSSQDGDLIHWDANRALLEGNLAQISRSWSLNCGAEADAKPSAMGNHYNDNWT
jgi:recombinational DNA repair ATPase RecF